MDKRTERWWDIRDAIRKFSGSTVSNRWSFKPFPFEVYLFSFFSRYVTRKEDDNNSCNSKWTCYYWFLWEIFFSLWIDKKPSKPKMNFISRSNDEWAISKIRDLHTCTTLWHNCLMRNYTWQKCNCLGFHHHHHRPYWKRRIQNENLQYAHIGLSGLNGNACVDTFTCLFNALYLQTLYSLSTMPVRIRMWWMLTQGTCNFSQYDKTTHQKCHRLTYCMRWNFATCTRIMHFHVLFLQFPVRVRRRISSWAQWHTT